MPGDRRGALLEDLKSKIIKFLNSPQDAYSREANEETNAIQKMLVVLPPITFITILNEILNSTAENRIEDFVSLFHIYELIQNPNQKQNLAIRVLKKLYQQAPNPHLAARILNKYIMQFPEQTALIYDFLITHVEFTSAITILCASLEESEKIKTISQLIKISINKGNAHLLQLLKNNFSEYYSSLVDSLNLSAIEKAKLQQWETLPNADFISEKLLEFTSDFQKLSYEGGLFALSEIFKRKKAPHRKEEDQYLFEPTLLDISENMDQFESYIQLLKSAAFPINEIFIFSSPHWFCGCIAIDESEVNVFFMDALGLTIEEDQVSSFIQEPSAICAKHFADKKLNIFFDKTERQHADQACSIFSLDDARHLYTAKKYLPKRYGQSGLFEYLKDNRKSSIFMPERAKIDAVEVILTSMPLSLLRTAQTSQLIKDKEIIEAGQKTYLPNYIGQRTPEEQMTPANKKGETAFESAVKGFNEKLRNLRLARKLESMVQHNEQYVLHTPREKIEETMTRFSLQGFIKRISRKNNKRPADSQRIEQLEKKLRASF